MCKYRFESYEVSFLHYLLFYQARWICRIQRKNDAFKYNRRDWKGRCRESIYRRLRSFEKHDILKAYREKLGFLFQNFALVENKTVEENILMIDKKYRNNTTVSAVLEKVGFIYFVRWRTAKSSHCASVYEKMQYYIGRWTDRKLG